MEIIGEKAYEEFMGMGEVLTFPAGAEGLDFSSGNDILNPAGNINSNKTIWRSEVKKSKSRFRFGS